MALTVIPSSGGGTGTAFPNTSPPIYVISNTITANYTFASGTNGMSVGPMTVNSGVTVTVPAGQRWVVI
jgi:hypothetical protein